MMFMFGGRRGFGRMGPAGLAFALYQGWRRMSPEQKAQIRQHAQSFGSAIRSRRPGAAPAPPPAHPDVVR
jgi:hypothetical protein